MITCIIGSKHKEEDILKQDTLYIKSDQNYSWIQLHNEVKLDSSEFNKDKFR